MDKVNVFKLRLGTLILLPFELTFEVLVSAVSNWH